MSVTALVADDEPLARQKVREFLAEVDWVTRVVETADGPDTLRALDALEPDLLFLDIQMPGCSGITVLERAKHRPVVIFTTAFDRYAVAAFELQALDYLLKPFGQERFHAAMERAREAMALRQDETMLERAREALTTTGGGPRRRLTRLFVRDRGRIVRVAVADIQRLEARDDYVAVFVAGRSHLVRMPMAEFALRLDPERFVQVHRSHIVNLDHIASLVPYDGVRLLIELRDGTRLMASRRRSKLLRHSAV